MTVIFSTIFTDNDDVVIGKVFMQEFKEGRRGSQIAPQVLFSHAEPLQELKGTDALTGDNVGYITIGELPVLITRIVLENAVRGHCYA